MKTYKILLLNGNVQDKLVNNQEWEKLHKDFKGYFKKEYSEFFKKYKIKPTIFNLNSLELFKGVVLTDSEFIKLKGGFKEKC